MVVTSTRWKQVRELACLRPQISPYVYAPCVNDQLYLYYHRETSPVNSSTVPLQPYNSPPDEMGEDESDVNVLGFYPNFNQDKALVDTNNIITHRISVDTNSLFNK